MSTELENVLEMCLEAAHARDTSGVVSARMKLLFADERFRISLFGMLSQPLKNVTFKKHNSERPEKNYK